MPYSDEQLGQLNSRFGLNFSPSPMRRPALQSRSVPTYQTDRFGTPIMRAPVANSAVAAIDANMGPSFDPNKDQSRMGYAEPGLPANYSPPPVPAAPVMAAPQPAAPIVSVGRMTPAQPSPLIEAMRQNAPRPQRSVASQIGSRSLGYIVPQNGMSREATHAALLAQQGRR